MNYDSGAMRIGEISIGVIRGVGVQCQQLSGSWTPAMKSEPLSLFSVTSVMLVSTILIRTNSWVRPIVGRAKYFGNEHFCYGCVVDRPFEPLFFILAVPIPPLRSLQPNRLSYIGLQLFNIRGHKRFYRLQVSGPVK